MADTLTSSKILTFIPEVKVIVQARRS